MTKVGSVTAVVVGVGCALWWGQTSVAGETAPRPLLRSDGPLPSETLALPRMESPAHAVEPGKLATEELSETDQVSLWQALSKARREIRRPSARQAERAADADVHFLASNPGQGLGVRFLSEGARVQCVRADRRRQATLRLAERPEPTEIAVSATRLEYTRGSVIEWYENHPAGIEHGFIFRERPASAGRELRVAIAVDGLRPRLPRATTAAAGLELVDADGNAVLSYGGLKVWDADGAVVPSRLECRGGEIDIVVSDRGARYPLTVDPLITALQAKVTPEVTGSGAANDSFGYSVSISGDSVIVGANGDDDNGSNSGSAYVFTRSGGTWTEQQKLTASDAAGGDQFGYSVSISGDSDIVGA